MRLGLSLVELSIVLVILGLLTGGILAGQSLILASELRSVSTEYQRYVTATYAFRDKYFGLPGDLATATRFWGAADAGDGLGTDCSYTPSTTMATCNGDGGGTVSAGATSESYGYWKHLANAGLIEGSFTGAPTTNPVGVGTRYASAGVNIPSSKYPSAAWFMMFVSDQDGTSWAWQGVYRNSFFWGGVEPTDITELEIIKPEDAWNIDTKADDGKPGVGKVRSTRTSTACTDTVAIGTEVSAVYALSTNPASACRLVMITGL